MSKYMDITKETQYSISLDYVKNQGQEKLGLMTNQSWHDDPKRLAFTFSRYKFVAKMTSDYLHIKEFYSYQFKFTNINYETSCK